MQLSRNVMLQDREKRNNNHGLAFMTGFTGQYKQVERIILAITIEASHTN